MNLRCRDCGRVEPEERQSTSGPFKAIDPDGELVRRWFYVCRHCCSDNLERVASHERA